VLFEWTVKESVVIALKTTALLRLESTRRLSVVAAQDALSTVLSVAVLIVFIIGLRIVGLDRSLICIYYGAIIIFFWSDQLLSHRSDAKLLSR